MSNNTKIRELTTVAGGFKVKVDNPKQEFVVSDTTVFDLGLKQGIVLTPSQIDVLRAESERHRCRQQVTRLLALRDHLSRELHIKLRSRGFDREVIHETLADYRRRGIIDDARTAQHMARALIDRKPCGRAYLISFLLKKGVDRTDADTIADTLLAGTDEGQRAIEALQGRWSEYRQFGLEDARTKAYNYLSRRGFSYDASRRAFEHMTKTENEVDEHQDG